jgi:hypothetical protein
VVEVGEIMAMWYLDPVVVTQLPIQMLVLAKFFVDFEKRVI